MTSWGWRKQGAERARQRGQCSKLLHCHQAVQLTAAINGGTITWFLAGKSRERHQNALLMVPKGLGD